MIVAATWGAPNQVGTWTFLLLWGCGRAPSSTCSSACAISASSSCRRICGYLRSFMPRKPMNLLMPVSVTAGTVVAALLASAHCAGHRARSTRPG